MHRSKMRRIQQEVEAKHTELRGLVAQEDKALAKSARLRKEIDAPEVKEDRAIAVEEADLLEDAEGVVSSPKLAMQPSTWSLSNGVLDDF